MLAERDRLGSENERLETEVEGNSREREELQADLRQSEQERNWLQTERDALHMELARTRAFSRSEFPKRN